MTKYIKYIFLSLLVAAGGFAFTSCSDDDDEQTIQSSQLPQAAKTFLSTYYPGDKITNVKMGTNPTTYDVYLSSGAEIDFDASGNWTEVQAPFGFTVPAGIVPLPIQEYVNINFPTAGITEISQSFSGYEVELSNGADLLFGPDGTYLGVG